MASILPENELIRRAAVWICDERAAKPGKSLHACLDEAGMRFNLSPLDQQKLAALFSGNNSACDAPGIGRTP
ncbi:MAG: hypothetical protein DELT_02208 [Desulfovibrio sp.]